MRDRLKAWLSDDGLRPVGLMPCRRSCRRQVVGNSSDGIGVKVGSQQKRAKAKQKSLLQTNLWNDEDQK